MNRRRSQYWGRPVNAPVHPHKEFEGTPLWKALKRSLMDLDVNQDIELTEWHQYIVGYICKKLAKADVVTAESLIKNSKTVAVTSPKT
jgi:hypothetical protein